MYPRSGYAIACSAFGHGTFARPQCFSPHTRIGSRKPGGFRTWTRRRGSANCQAWARRWPTACCSSAAGRMRRSRWTSGSSRQWRDATGSRSGARSTSRTSAAFISARTPAWRSSFSSRSNAQQREPGRYACPQASWVSRQSAVGRTPCSVCRTQGDWDNRPYLNDRRSLLPLDQLHLVPFGCIDEGDNRTAARFRGAIAQRVTLGRRLRSELLEIVHLEGQVHQVRLHLDGGRTGHLAQFDFLVAIRRGQESQLRTARGGVTAAHLESQRFGVGRDGALEVVDAHPRVEEFLHNGHTRVPCAERAFAATATAVIARTPAGPAGH